MTNLILNLVFVIVTNTVDIDVKNDTIARLEVLRTNTVAELTYNGKTNKVIVEESAIGYGRTYIVTNAAVYTTNVMIYGKYWYSQ